MTEPTATANIQPIDMSPEAIDLRLRKLGQLYKLGMSLRGAQLLGQINSATEKTPLQAEQNEQPKPS